MFRLCYIIICIAFPLSFLSCSSANLQISDCEINQETNFFVKEEIKKSEIDNLSGKRLAELKTKLIVQINTSLTSKSQLIQSVEGEISQEQFLVTTTSESFGDLTNPKLSFCQKGKNRFVTLSVDKEKFLSKIRLTLLNKIDVTERMMSSFLESYNDEKYSFNKKKLEQFDNEIIQIESLNRILISNPRLFNDDYKIQKVIEIKSMFNELSKLVDSFDREMGEIDELIAQKNYKSAYQKISSLSDLFDSNSNIGKQISAKKSKIKDFIKNFWSANYRMFHKHVIEGKFNYARENVLVLWMLAINDSLHSEYKKIKGLYIKELVKFETNRLMNGKTKKSEITFGIDVSSHDGATNFSLDRSIPVLSIGLTHNFLVYPRIGVIAKFKHNTNSNIGFEKIGRDFNSPFNEISGGILVGPLEINFGKVLDYDFTSLETKYSIFRGDKKGLKNYIQLHVGFNYLYSVNNARLNQFSVSTGLNYNFRFNRKLDKQEKKYIASLHKF